MYVQMLAGLVTLLTLCTGFANCSLWDSKALQLPSSHLQESGGPESLRQVAALLSEVQRFLFGHWIFVSLDILIHRITIQQKAWEPQSFTRLTIFAQVLIELAKQDKELGYCQFAAPINEHDQPWKWCNHCGYWSAKRLFLDVEMYHKKKSLRSITSIAVKVLKLHCSELSDGLEHPRDGTPEQWCYGAWVSCASCCISADPLKPEALAAVRQLIMKLQLWP